MKKILFYAALPVLLLIIVTSNEEANYVDLGMFSLVWLLLGFLFSNGR